MIGPFRIKAAVTKEIPIINELNKLDHFKRYPPNVEWHILSITKINIIFNQK